MKIAMWSGPRNLSTAMMYAFGNRGDTACLDEPFYAAYLDATGLDHPMRDAVLAAHDRSPGSVAKRLAGPIPDGKAVWYQKHMAFHMIEGFPLGWAETCVNVHLIRHPARVVASYAAKRENPTFEDIGFRQQADIHARLPGPVIDSADIRRDPNGMLQRLCSEIGLPFDPGMLTWAKGPRPFDGAWAAHWYGSVHRSTGFAGPEGNLPDVSSQDRVLVDRALPFYEALREIALRP